MSSTGHIALLKQFITPDPLTEAQLTGLVSLLHLFFIPAIYVNFHNEIMEYPMKRSREFYHLCISVIPAGLGGLLISQALTLSSEPSFIGVGFIGTGVFMLLALRYFQKNHGDLSSDLKRGSAHLMHWKDAVFIGLLQVPAAFPGISRLGMALGAGMIVGLRSKTLARYSFVLAIPIILGQTIIEFKNVSGLLSTFSPISIVMWGAVIITCGVGGIKLFMQMIQKHLFPWICFYLFAVGGAVLLFEIF